MELCTIVTIIASMVIIRFLSTVKGDLMITPSDPVKVLIYSLPLRYFTLKCTCEVGCDNNSIITWELPNLMFAELQPYHYETLKKAARNGTLFKISNDLLSRTNISLKYNENGTISSLLRVKSVTKWDEGYYACRSGNQSKQIYVLPIELIGRKGRGELGEVLKHFHLNPSKMVYIVSSHQQSASSLIIPCSWGYPPDKYQQILQFKSANNVSKYGKWTSVINQHKRGLIIKAWTSNYTIYTPLNNHTVWYYGLELSFSPSYYDLSKNGADGTSSFGLYRCASFTNRTYTTFPDDVSGSAFVISIEESLKSTTNEPNNKPVIRPVVKFMVFQTGSHFSLSCEIGIGWNITWRTSSSPSLLERISTNSSSADANNQVITATLTVKAASYLDTGYYTCHRSDNESISAKQFIFIQDMERLILPAHSQNSRPLEEDQDFIFHSSAVIGCAPTTPLVDDVILYRKNKESDFIQVYSSLLGDGRNDEGSSESKWEYNIFQGFKIKNVTWELAGEYQCMGLYHSPTVNFGIYNKSETINKTNSIFTIHVKGIELLTPPNSKNSVIEGGTFQLSCRWKIYNNTNNSSDVNWRLILSDNLADNVVTTMNANHSSIPGIKIAKKTISNGFYVSQLSWINITMDAKGSSFNCILDNTSSSFYIINVTKDISPRIVRTLPSTSNNYNNEIYVSPGEPLSLTCQVETLTATTQYFWISTRGKIDNDSRYIVKYSENDSNLSFSVAHNFTGDNFTCYFINSLTNKTDSRAFRVRLRVAGSSLSVIGIAVALILVTVVLLILTPLLCRTIYLNRKQKQTKRKKRKDVIEGYRERRKNPYNPRWEFPRNRLTLGEELGSGEFGVVFKGIALGTADDPLNVKAKTVAVKMAKSSIHPTALKSLTSELRILIHLGPHLNIVNLFGACTKKFADGELLVIEEFCRYGNLHDYLVASRCLYVNQLDGDGNLLTPSQNNEPNSFDDTYLDGCGSDYQHQGYFSADNNYDRISRDDNSIHRLLEYRDLDPLRRETSINSQKQGEHDNNIRCDGAAGDEIDGYLSPPMLNDDVLPGSERHQITLSTRNLIHWSFQISRGMSHLESKKVIHRDLAARNILLAEGNVVKIADFGLARQLSNYTSDGIPIYCMKKGKEDLPVKWTAIESLVNRIFSTKSDVWSFGVLIWEIFSLGAIPYADVTSLSELINFLQEDRRLDKPTLIPNLVGDLMISCWEKEPGDRPTFTRIEEDLGKMLEESVQHLYFTVDNDDLQTSFNDTTKE